MLVRCVRDSVELEIGHRHPGLFRLEGELRLLRETQAVRGRLHAPIADLLRVATGVQEVGRDRRLATAELHGHLTARLEGTEAFRMRFTSSNVSS